MLRWSTLLPVALVALLAILPACMHSQSSALVAAKQPHTNNGVPSYVPVDSDLDDPDDDDDDTVSSDPRRAQAQAVADAVQRLARAEANEEEPQQHVLRMSIEAAVAAQSFAPRGSVTLNFAPSRGSKAIAFSVGQSGSKKQIKDALATNPSALYRLRFVQEGEKTEDAITASVPACALAVSHFHENFIFHVDPYGTLLAVTYRTPLSDCASSEVGAALAGSSDLFPLAPKARISFGKPGEKAKTHIRPGFDASSQANAQAVGSEPAPVAAQAEQAERGPDGKPLPPPQTFWQKYWIYIVPLGIFMLLQAVMAPPEPAGPSAGGAAPRAQ